MGAFVFAFVVHSPPDPDPPPHAQPSNQVNTDCWNKVASIRSWMQAEGKNTETAYGYFVDRVQVRLEGGVACGMRAARVLLT